MHECVSVMEKRENFNSVVKKMLIEVKSDVHYLKKNNNSN